MTRILSTTRTTLPRSIAALALGYTVAAVTQASTEIPRQGGWSGYVNIGAGALDVKSNMMSAILSGNIDVSESNIDSLSNSPDTESNAIPAINFEIAYTFAEARTQLHLGNEVTDFLDFDTSTVAGVRHDFGIPGLVGANARITSVASQVWRDPYAINVERNDTERSSTGFAVYWQRVMTSGLELRYTSANVDIHKEQSGQALGLSTAQQDLLDRNGDIYRFDGLYEFSWDGGRHTVTPGLGYIDNNLDGDAMANNGGVVELNYSYRGTERWRYTLSASYAELDFTDANPIYNQKDSAERYGASLTAFFKAPFGLQHWSSNFMLGWYGEDHDIDFYDSSVGVLSVGMLRRF